MLSALSLIHILIGRKVGMTQIFDEKGNVIPVTVIEAGPCVVAQVKTVETADIKPGNCMPINAIPVGTLIPVSYTHLDVYKRQIQN